MFHISPVRIKTVLAYAWRQLKLYNNYRNYNYSSTALTPRKRWHNKRFLSTWFWKIVWEIDARQAAHHQTRKEYLHPSSGKEMIDNNIYQKYFE